MRQMEEKLILLETLWRSPASRSVRTAAGVRHFWGGSIPVAIRLEPPANLSSISRFALPVEYRGKRHLISRIRAEPAWVSYVSVADVYRLTFASFAGSTLSSALSSRSDLQVFRAQSI